MTDERRVLLLAHPGRLEARQVAVELVDALTGHDIRVRLLPEERSALGIAERDGVELAGNGDPSAGCELVVVIGGDGTILRAAEMARDSGTPILGVNLGHVGFLAEAEYDDVDATIEAIVERRYTWEDRLTVDVSVFRDGELVVGTFALNEASVEKAARERMLEVVVEIDGRPLSRWAATAWCARRLPAPRRTTSAPGDPWSGPVSRRC
jgi:NAD+ kinase